MSMWKEQAELKKRIDEAYETVFGIRLKDSFKDEPKDGGSTPDQYGLPSGAKELQDLIEYRDMNFSIGNIFKACYRLGTKNDDMYELNKMKWFIDREIKKVKKETGE